MADKLFRLFDKRDKIWVYQDKNLLDGDFPEYLAMIHVQGREFFELNEWIGEQDQDGNNIYESDIIKYQDFIYEVSREGFEFLPIGVINAAPDVEVNECEVIGNKYENPELLT